MRKTMFLAVVPFLVAACTSNSCPNPQRCATCPFCNPQAAKLAPATAPASPSGSSAVTSAFPASTTKVYRIAPAKMAQMTQQAITAAPLNLKIISADGGVIQTDWKAYEGELHVFRRWQDRTRYRITVVPDVNDPLNASRFDVAEETQRRSNDLANWQTADRHPERIEALVQVIDAKLR
jgi:hypothetical protein